MAYQNGPKIVTNGLVLCLDAGNTKSYPGTGTVWTDLSKNGNNGTLTNGPTFSSANGGNIVFDGTNDYVSCGDLGNFYPQGTISFWMYSTAVENYRNPFSTGYLAGNNCIRFEQYTTVAPYGGFAIVIGNNSSYSGFDYSPTSVLTPNAWYEIVAVWDTSTNNIIGYMNGVLKFNTTCSTWPSTLPSISIGSGFSVDRYFKGGFSNVKIYNRALTSTEVFQNYNATKSRFGL